MKNRIIIAIALLLIAGVISGCAENPAGRPITGRAVQQKQIELGFISPSSGALADVGIGFQKGAELALAEINSKGGINGTRLKLIYENGECMPKQAVTAAQKLISIDRVPAIIGPACSSSILPVAPIANANRIPIIGILDASEEVSAAGPYVFSNGFSIESGGHLMAQYAYDELGVRSVAIMYDTDDWAMTMAGAFKEEFERLGGTVLTVLVHQIESQDFRTELLKMESTDPDAMYIVTIGEVEGIVFKQAKELGIETQFLGADNFGLDTVLLGAGDAAEGAYFSYQLRFGDDNKELAGFKQRYAAMYGDEPANVLYPAMGYDNVMLVAEVMQKHGITSEQIRRGLLETRAFNGVVGTSSFDSQGVANRKQFINTVRDGEFVAVD